MVTLHFTQEIANHINDISKIDPDLALKTITDWQKPEEMQYIIGHSLRTLVKQAIRKQ